MALLVYTAVAFSQSPLSVIFVYSAVVTCPLVRTYLAEDLGATFLLLAALLYKALVQLHATCRNGLLHLSGLVDGQHDVLGMAKLDGL